MIFKKFFGALIELKNFVYANRKNYVRQILYMFLILIVIIMPNREYAGAVEHEYFGILLGLLVLIHLSGKKFLTLFGKSKRGIFNFLLIGSFLLTIITGFAISTTAVHFVTLRGATSLLVHQIHIYAGYFTTFMIILHVISRRKIIESVFFTLSSNESPEEVQTVVKKKSRGKKSRKKKKS